MTTTATKQADIPEQVGTAPISLKRILVALDQSDYANRALQEAAKLVKSADGAITGIHAYAAKLHDRRFKQMEGGLPERYRIEQEMEHQREVHKDLIGMGLGIISDSYHDNALERCTELDVPYKKLSPEGKNYSRIIAAMKDGDFDVLALGALGLGAVAGSVIGTVCERVVRRAPIDVLVIKDTKREIGDGPIVVGLDGSPQSFGALASAIDIGTRLNIAVHVIAAYDPYYHYVAFNKIAGVLSEEAGKVFRFKEQEQLHEELIDEGIAKIYQSHLAIAETVAQELGAEISTELLAGKPYQAIKSYVEKVGASLLMVGKVGVHADAELDIGGNTENLLRAVPCHIWITQSTYYPSLDVIAEETIAWSEEAEAKINRAPDFVRNMARQAVIRQAHSKGHTFITEGFVDDVMKKMMPGGQGSEAAAGTKEKFDPLPWSAEAEDMIGQLEQGAVVENIRLRAEKAARRDAATQIAPEHVSPFLEDAASSKPASKPGLNWTAAALARLQRVPEAMRAKGTQCIERYALEKGANEIDLDIVEESLEIARDRMAHIFEQGDGG